MKKSELRQLVRETAREVLNENLYSDFRKHLESFLKKRYGVNMIPPQDYKDFLKVITDYKSR